MDRTSFGDWKRHFELQRLEGPNDLPRIRKSHPRTTRAGVVVRIVEPALRDLGYDSNCDEALQALEGRRVSAVTIPHILEAKEPGTRLQRRLALKKPNADDVFEPAPEQAGFPNRLDPCFRERHIESSRPGQLFSADTSIDGTLRGLGRVYRHVAVEAPA